ncbi:hypothetical protein [Paraflavitalea pollutisoli]|uniref:hypothetical protein n=1 Tax=Paraflavitalea pollutisoli TaxID=3034143 RepID=UPI0023EDE608|nr:hypothetical protein [Paraflavitalea sp. H1-2-19X]
MKLSFNYSLLASVLLITTACQHKAAPVAGSGSQATVQTPTTDRTYMDAAGNLHLLGLSTRERLAQAPFASWFDQFYNGYTIDTATAGQLKPLLKNKKFVIFMGTWCGDSKREVPRMYKLLDYCGVKSSQIKLINVNNADSAYKQSPGHEERGLSIFRVPDLLVYDKNGEAGRIVESPIVSLEKDLLAIVQKQPYTPKYPGVAYLIQQFQSSNWQATPAMYEQAAAQMKPQIKHWGELASFSRVMLTSGYTDRAIDAMQIATLLYPAETGAFLYLATAYVKKGNTPAAKACCEKVLQLQPGNADAMAFLKGLEK